MEQHQIVSPGVAGPIGEEPEAPPVEDNGGDADNNNGEESTEDLIDGSDGNIRE